MKISFFLLFFFVFQFLWNKSPIISSVLLVGMSTSLLLYFSCLLNLWIGVILALVYIGGMMILLMYVSSLSFNTKNMHPSSSLILMMPLLSFWFAHMLTDSNAFWSSSNSDLYLSFNLTGVMFLILYLLVVMLLCVKLTEGFKGALVEKF